jgi:hypothetical protein
MALDPIDDYLDELLARLRGPASDVRRTLGEAEAHLRDAVDEQVAAGIELAQAQRVSIERFGSVAQVAATANRSLEGRKAVQVLGALLWAAGRMVAVGVASVGIAAVLARALAVVTSTAFVFGVPADAVLPADRCAHWLSVQPSATTCSQAAMLENSSDTFQFYTGGAVLGLVVLGVAFTIRAIVRRAQGTARAGIVLPLAAVPAIGATVFGGTGAALLSAGISDVMLPGFWGRGLWFVDAGVAILVALSYAVIFVRAVLAGPGTIGGPTAATAAVAH